MPGGIYVGEYVLLMVALQLNCTVVYFRHTRLKGVERIDEKGG
jgi:hypothetical protein